MATRSNRPADDAGPDQVPGNGAEGVPDPIVGAFFSDLLTDVNREVVSWIPKGEGATIAGLVKSRERITTEPEPGRKIEAEVTVLDTDPADQSKPFYRVAWLGVVLDTAVRRYDPQPGDQVALRQLGRIDTGRPRRDGAPGNETYHDWRVVVRKAPEASG